MNEHTPEFLKELQSMPMEAKVFLTQARIIEFYGGHHPGMGYGNAYVSFSGGKDSTVLLDIARKIYPEIPAAFSNTGLEYPEIRQFAKAHDNVEVVTPKMPFNEVISRYGYPLIGKEVAEAIYYARRIAGSERERERDAGRTCTDISHDNPKENGSIGRQNLVETSSARNRRTILLGAYPHTHTHKRSDKPTPQARVRRRTELQGELTSNETGQPIPKNRGEWADWRRGCL